MSVETDMSSTIWRFGTLLSSARFSVNALARPKVLILVFCIAFLSSCREARITPAPAAPDYGPRGCVSSESLSAAIEFSHEKGTAEAYEAEQAAFDETRAVQVAAAFGLSGAPEFDDDLNEFAFSDGATQLHVGRYVVDYYAGQGNATGGEQVSESKAVEIVDDVLTTAGLYPTSDVSVESKVDPSGAAVTITPKGLDLAEITWQEIVAGIDDSGKLLNLSYHWQNLRPYGEYPVISQAQAFKRLQNCGGIGFLPPISGFNMKVTEVGLRYLGIANSDGSAYLYFLPIYEFSGEPAARPKGSAWEKVDRVIAFVPAVADEYLQDNTPVPQSTPQP